MFSVCGWQMFSKLQDVLGVKGLGNIREVKLGKNAKIARIWMKSFPVLKLLLFRFYYHMFKHWSPLLTAFILNSDPIYFDLNIIPESFILEKKSKKLHCGSIS